MEQRLACRERPSGGALMYQDWRELLFVHWRVEPERVQRTLPEGLYVDTFEGATYVGVVPFFMRNVRPRFVPPLPWLSNFLELNVRTYVHDAYGRPGVWFYSLDCNQPVAVWGARTFFHLPYRHARMSVRSVDRTHDYRSQVKEAPRACDVTYAIDDGGRPAAAGSLEFFLLERYLLFIADRRGRLYYGQVHHQPYPAATATIAAWSSNLLAEHDFGVDETRPDHFCGARGVDVEVFELAPVEA